jgi:hypothetical protein
MANNEPMTRDHRIEDLYKGSPGEFVSARNALAKTLTGDEARRVKRLQKPTAVAWAVNRLYWHARPAYDRLADAGRRLRSAQVATLKGRSSDVRRAAEAHRTALAHAVAESLRLAGEIGLHPNDEEVARTLEALSVSAEPPEPPGQLTHALRPAGFEALAGVRGIKAPQRPASAAGAERVDRVEEPADRGAEPDVGSAAARKPSAAVRRQQAAAERERRRKERLAQKKIDRATKTLARARAAEEHARTAWERARREAAEAQQKLEALQK